MIALACDHIAIGLKEEKKALLNEMGIPYKDFRTYSTDRTDYPIYASRAARAVASGDWKKVLIAAVRALAAPSQPTKSRALYQNRRHRENDI